MPQRPPAQLDRWLPAVGIAALSWPAVYRLFWPGYLATGTGIFHLTRMIEFNALVRAGVSYPRWFPDFGLGLGLPILNYYSPLSYYLAEGITLTGVELQAAVQISIALGFLLSGWGMYLLARVMGAPHVASVLAALLYVYFPYHLQDLYSRGAMAELLAIALIPWVVWSQTQALRTPSAPRVAAAVFLVAVEILAHNLTAVFAVPLATIWSLVLAGPRVRSVLKAAAIDTLGLLLSAGYWLPAVAQQDLAHLANFRDTPLAEHTFDLPNLIQHDFFGAYGDQSFRMVPVEALALAILVLAAIVGVIVLHRPWQPAFLVVLSLALLVWSMTPWSIPFWQAVPIINFVQFPWRMLIPVGFTLAASAALVGGSHRLAWLGLLPLTAAMALASVGSIPSARFALPDALDARTLLAQEFGTGAEAGVTESEFLPATASPEVLKIGQGGQLAADTTVAPAIEIARISHAGTRWEFQTTASQDAVLRLQQFFFPGWAARIDGKPITVRAGSPAALVELSIPAGTHQIEVNYDGTPLQAMSAILSGATALALAAASVFGRSGKLATLVAGTLLAVTAGLFLVPGRAAGQAVQPTYGKISANQLLVAAEPPAYDSSGISVRLFWMFNKPDEGSFDFVVTDASGRESARWSSTQAATLPAEYVAVNELLSRRYTLSGKLPLPSGDYQLSLESASAGSVALGQVRISSSSDPGHQIDLPFEDKATLLDYRIERLQNRLGLHPVVLPGRADGTAFPGDFVLVSFRWQAQQRMYRNYIGFVHLLDVEGHTWASRDNDPNATLSPTSSWVPGQIVVDRYPLKLPDDIPPGIYRLEAGLYHLSTGFDFLHPNGQGNSALFGSLKIRARRAPAATPPNAARWTEPMELLGWRYELPGNQVAITLDWASSGAVSANYTLFVHLLDAAGQTIAQADAPPQHGLFPTSLWEAGDRIADQHVLESPPAGRYQLDVGWYRAETGTRLPLDSGTDVLHVGEISIP